MKALLVTLAMLGAGHAFAEMNCVPRTAVIYSPDKNWSELNNVLPDHLNFIGAHLGKEMLEGGPFSSADGKSVTGGLMIYSLLDQAAVEAIVRQDPFIKNNVAKYEIRPWLQCVQ